MHTVTCSEREETSSEEKARLIEVIFLQYSGMLIGIGCECRGLWGWVMVGVCVCVCGEVGAQ